MRRAHLRASGRPRLNVSIPAGEIDIETQPGPEAFVRLSPVVDDEESREAVERAHVELHGSELAVKVKDKRFHLGAERPRSGPRSPFPTGRRPACTRPRPTSAPAERSASTEDTRRVGRRRARPRRRAAQGALGQRWRASRRRRATRRTSTAPRATSTSRARTAPVKVHTASGDVAVGDAGAGPIRVHSASGDVEHRGPRRAARGGRRPHGERQGRAPTFRWTPTATRAETHRSSRSRSTASAATC